VRNRNSLTGIASSLYRDGMARLCILIVVCMASFSFGAMPGPADLPVRLEMPDPLMGNDGQKITNAEQWKARREEMKGIIEEYEFGHSPPAPGNVTGREVFTETISDSNVQYRAVHLSFGPDGKLGFDIGIFSPTGAGPFPTIVHLNYFPVPTAAPATQVATTQTATTRLSGSGRGRGLFRAQTPASMAAQYAQQLKRGYAVVTINYQQLGADNANYRKSAFFPAYPDYDWRDISAWAWGISRCIDFLQDDPTTDKSKIIAVGHSRVGQAVLLAGAFDERIALVAPAGGGCAFRYCGKGRGGKQGVDEIVAQNTIWFGPRFEEFKGQTEKLPFDQNWLIALAAPRYYILCNGTDDQYVNGNAAAESYLGAKPVYALLGATDNLGINFRPGPHMLSATDWAAILDFADVKLRGMPAGRKFDVLPPADQLH
jgi:hypothetical protein